MSVSLKEIVTGRKTFFITPDTSLFPQSFLEDYFALGYECYFIEYDKRVSLARKVEILISLFHDVIFFFNIDYNSNEFDWFAFIKKIITTHNNRASIGVVYTKRQSQIDKAKIETSYLFDLGLGCGCIQLEYQKKTNFAIIERILSANQAQGRRKNIRAICTKSCTFNFTHKEKQVNGSIQDISLSHFTISLSPSVFDIDLYERILDVHFNIRGFMFRSDVVLIMKRRNNYENLLIFAFTSNGGKSGLEQRIKQLLIPNIYQLMNANCKDLLEELYNNMQVNNEISELEESYGDSWK